MKYNNNIKYWCHEINIIQGFISIKDIRVFNKNNQGVKLVGGRLVVPLSVYFHKSVANLFVLNY